MPELFEVTDSDDERDDDGICLRQIPISNGEEKQQDYPAQPTGSAFTAFNPSVDTVVSTLVDPVLTVVYLCLPLSTIVEPLFTHGLNAVIESGRWGRRKWPMHYNISVYLLHTRIHCPVTSTPERSGNATPDRRRDAT
ncbi:hypothetical protein GGX14DRAFT_384252 [Mycena pura]|uniref:Uncharacterized protein n=1 Tax=Mycena pura TaxID=153505 RepID=A0AAD7E5S1_9AGAR|nr:hypothetical protein GGX14DRAFT_384252 [Mycena pura]